MQRNATGDATRATYTLFAVVVSLWLVSIALPDLVFGLKQYPPDGSQDWSSAHSFAEGVNPYSPEGLKLNGRDTTGHPPTTAVWFLPLLRFPLEQSTLPLGIFTLLLLLLHTQILTHELSFPLPLVTGILGFALMAATTCVKSHLHAGQISEMIAFLYLLSWYFLRKDRELAAGSMLGLACTLKLFPGVMVLFLVMRRRWRAVAMAAGTYLVLATAVTVRFGMASWRQFFALQGPTARDWMGVIQNASLEGILVRLFGPSCGATQATPGPMTTVIFVVLGGLMLFGAWRATRRLPIDYAFVLFSVVSVFLNAWVWEHYYVLYLLPIATILSEMRRIKAPRAQIVLAAAATTAAAALLALDTSIPKFSSLQTDYHAPLHSAWTHLRLHLYEVGNWMPAVLLMGVLAWIAVPRGRTPEALLYPNTRGANHHDELLRSEPRDARIGTGIAAALIVILTIRAVYLMERTGNATLDVASEYTLLGEESGKCVTPAPGQAVAGTRLELRSCDGGSAQRYRPELMSDGRYALRNVQTDLCMDVSQASEASGAPIVQWYCSGNLNQRWAFAQGDPGTYEVITHCGRLVGVVDSRTEDGALLEQTSSSGRSARFRLSRSAPSAAQPK